MSNLMNEGTLKVINEAVITIPGLMSFAEVNKESGLVLATKEIDKAIEVSITEKIHRLKIHIILLNGVNIKDVATEVQIRVKYELEKLSNFTNSYYVDVVVDALAK
ncbi:Asp23/Gls24 family envelope stress response protein [Spiroplasma alleghenense]|uniref:Asp23/Gls24 family envelope stress response protein n=1 Tax=Spiroplasma alleghenense TaxID=216931 RepID=A0A345Z415_9MOLU|nr:Asp23/Gls24 family envelope stress response protein [Spiroplasma alleghenense]AXK51344.1 Asp23/Gls24 family envelope stress response protein [Spiroplasma alleghenense]